MKCRHTFVKLTALLGNPTLSVIYNATKSRKDECIRMNLTCHQPELAHLGSYHQ